jgi:hypothetical protein
VKVCIQDHVFDVLPGLQIMALWINKSNAKHSHLSNSAGVGVEGVDVIAVCVAAQEVRGLRGEGFPSVVYALVTLFGSAPCSKLNLRREHTRRPARLVKKAVRAGVQGSR